jgi:hypothetical protein
MEDGEPEHTNGFETFLEAGVDITCDCVFRDALRECGYALDTHGNYVRRPAGIGIDSMLD